MDVYDAMLVRLAGRGTGAELPDDANQLVLPARRAAAAAAGEQQALLADGTTAERLARLARLLRREIALLQRTRSIAVSPAVLRMGPAATERARPGRRGRAGSGRPRSSRTANATSSPSTSGRHRGLRRSTSPVAWTVSGSCAMKRSVLPRMARRRRRRR